jgi:Leucine-rich repeat (LRR) protein
VRAEADALNLGNLSLCAVPDSVLLGLPPRGSLSLANNFLASVSTSLHHLTSVRALDLSHNLIATFAQQRDFASSSRQPAEHGGGAWPNLTELNLGYNRLWCLEQLPVTLTSLNVAHNVIERLPKHISLLTNLRVLNLSHNKFAIIQGTSPIPL